jgi:hypothetical protein
MLVANGIFNVVLMRFARRCFARDGSTYMDAAKILSLGVSSRICVKLPDFLN